MGYALQVEKKEDKNMLLLLLLAVKQYKAAYDERALL